MNETCLVDGRPLCGKCMNKLTDEERNALSDEELVRQTDPTVCVQCDADNGEQELPRVANCPVCEACDHQLRHRPFPAWVKLALAGLLLLAAITLVQNVRFFLGYAEIQRAFRALGAGDLPRAGSLMRAAAGHVPERCELGGLASLFSAFDLMRRDRPKEAIPELQHARTVLRPGDQWRTVADDQLLVAESAAAFDAKDYDVFLAKSQEFRNRHPEDPFAQLALASAHACQYAVHGLEPDKQQALDLLAEVSRTNKDSETQDSRQRILHRLSTRKILSAEEFHKQFPQGWHEGQKP
jgi:hypothetical protein